MAAITNLFSIEDNLAMQLALISDIKEIYREAITEGLSEAINKTPSLCIADRGFLTREDVARVTSPKLTTLWEIGIACKKQDYKAVGGAKTLEVIRVINGFQADDWIKPAKLTPADDKNEPMYKGGLAYYPLLFAIEILI